MRITRIVCTLILLILFVISFNNFVFADSDWTGNINVVVGRKSLDKDDWEPVEKHDEFGIQIDFRQQSWPVSIAIDLLFSKDKGSEFCSLAGRDLNIEGKTTEINFGFRKIIEDKHDSIRPFFGAGLSLINGEASVEGDGVDDDGTGFWIGGGAYWMIADRFNLGLEIKYTKAELDDFKAEAGGTHFLGLIGFHL